MVWKWSGRIQYQHADAKMQMRGWMNAVYGWRRGYVPSHVKEKRDTREVRNVVAENAVSADREEGGRRNLRARCGGELGY
jgi:hypothetical protein